MLKQLLLSSFVLSACQISAQDNWIPTCSFPAMPDTVIHGEYFDYHFSVLDNNLYHFEWWTNGRKVREYNYVAFNEEDAGYIEGDWISYDHGQVDHIFHFENGKPEGPAIWYIDGKPVSETNYKNGLRHGTYTYRDTSGTVRTAGEFRLGAKVGIWRSWYPNGVLKSEGSYLGTGSYFVSEPYDTSTYDYSEYPVLEYDLNDVFKRGWEHEEFFTRIIEPSQFYREMSSYEGVDYHFPKIREWRYYSSSGVLMRTEQFDEAGEIENRYLILDVFNPKYEFYELPNMSGFQDDFCEHVEASGYGDTLNYFVETDLNELMDTEHVTIVGNLRIPKTRIATDSHETIRLLDCGGRLHRDDEHWFLRIQIPNTETILECTGHRCSIVSQDEVPIR